VQETEPKKPKPRLIC